MATHASTTDLRRRRSTRRTLLAGSAALTIAAAGAATMGIRSMDDAALMRAVDHFRGCHAAVLALEASTGHEWSEVEKAGEAWNEAVDEICAIAPITPAGLAAKAGAMKLALRAEVGSFIHPEAFEARAEPHDRLAMALAQDVLRPVGGAA